MAFGNRNCAAAVFFARVLAGATVIATAAATLPLAVILALAIMLGRRRTTAMAFAGIFGGAAIVAGFATPLTLALVHALAYMLLAAFSCLFLSNYATSLRAGNDPSHSAEQQLVKISSFHTHPGTPPTNNAKCTYIRHATKAPVLHPDTLQFVCRVSMYRITEVCC